MIYPITLYNFGKSCPDSAMAGNILRALCKQDVKLTAAEQVVLSMIRNDNEWMNERIDDQRERWKERQRKARAKNVTDVTPCHRDNGDTPNVTIPTYLPTSLPTSNTDINRSVPVKGGVPPPPPNGNGNGTGNLSSRGKAARAAVEEFKAAHRRDRGAFFDPDYPAAVICLALTDDYDSATRWCQLVRQKGDAAVRDEAYAFYSELLAGETVENRGATLNTRLGALPDLKPQNDTKGNKENKENSK